MAALFPSYVITVLELFRKHGFEAYVVGGAVRDLLARDPHIVARRRSTAGAVRKQYLQLPYLHWAEELGATGLSEAYLAAARGEFGLTGQT